LVLRAGLEGGGAREMTLIATAVGLLSQVNIKGRWYELSALTAQYLAKTLSACVKSDLSRLTELI
jgi:hypothetical protein